MKTATPPEKSTGCHVSDLEFIPAHEFRFPSLTVDQMVAAFTADPEWHYGLMEQSTIGANWMVSAFGVKYHVFLTSKGAKTVRALIAKEPARVPPRTPRLESVLREQGIQFTTPKIGEFDPFEL